MGELLCHLFVGMLPGLVDAEFAVNEPVRFVALDPRPRAAQGFRNRRGVLERDREETLRGLPDQLAVVPIERPQVDELPSAVLSQFDDHGTPPASTERHGLDERLDRVKDVELLATVNSGHAGSRVTRKAYPNKDRSSTARCGLARARAGRFHGCRTGDQDNPSHLTGSQVSRRSCMRL